MRRCYLVCYDICNSKRLQKVFKVMKGYGERWQLSVFFCILKDIDRVRMKADLESVMNLKEDQVIIIDLGTNEKNARENLKVLGKTLIQQYERVIVI